MSVTLQNTEKNVVRLDFDIDAGEFNKAMDKAFLKNKKKFAVPGFRKGKAPRQIVQNYYGENVFYEDALGVLFPEVYDSAVSEHGIEPVDDPQIVEIKQIGSGKNLLFSASVTVKPEITPGDYKGIEVEKQEVSVTDEDVENEIRKAAERNARVMPLEEERGLQEGDTAVIDYKGFIDDEQFDGGEAQDQELEIGSGSFIKGFEQQLIGAFAGEDREIKVTFPDDYESRDLAGRDASFKVSVKQIKIKELPEIDDEFAKDVSEFDTLREYKEDLKEKLIKREEERIRHEIEQAVVKKVAENSTVDIPTVMLEREIDRFVREYELSMQYRGLTMEQFYKLKGINESGFRDSLRKEAEEQVKIRLMLEKIADIEGIEVSGESIEEELKSSAQMYKTEVDKLKERMSESQMQQMKYELKIRQTVKFLVDNAKVK